MLVKVWRDAAARQGWAGREGDGGDGGRGLGGRGLGGPVLGWAEER